jgi:hypothetical protein
LIAQLAAALALATAPASPPPAPSPPLPVKVFHGRMRHIEASVPRFDAGITVDGILDEPEWKQATVLTGFSQYSPADGIAAEDSIEVLVWYSPTAINFGIRAFEAHGAVHSTLATRDKIDSDDYVQLLVDTFNDGRQAMLFGVNPLGVQQDGIISETGILRGGSGFGSAGGVREAPDLNPDFVFLSKGRLTDFGYEVEISIPFKTLRFKPGTEQKWGLQVIRKVQHNGHEEVWAPANRAAASFLAQSGHLTGLTDMHRGLVVDLTPELVEQATGAAAGAAGSRWQYSASQPSVGGNVRWGITQNLTLNGTVKPDFSQVEADVVQLSYDPRRAIAYPEKRPFFLEGTEQFNVPNTLIYSRDIVQPDAAAKITGKMAGTNIAFLSALDGRSYSLDGAQPIFNILRAQHDFGASSRLGVAYTDVEDGGDFNRVADVDARLVWNKIYSVQAQLAESFDRTAGATTNAPMWYARIDRAGRDLQLRFITNAVADDFLTRAGFVARAGIGHMNGNARYVFYGAPGALFESFAPSVSLDGTWTYEKFVRAGDVQDLKWNFGLTGALRGGWQLNAALLVETFGYDSTLYTTYRIEERNPGGAGLDTARFTGTPHLANFDYSLNLSTPILKYFDANLSVIWGKDDNFYEWSPANVDIGSFTLNVRPTEQFRVNFIYKESRYVRRSDGSTVDVLRVPRLKVEYQLTRSIYVRYVGQYTALHTDSLRDDSRTNAPILICTTTCARSAAVNSNSFRSDVLFAYQPVPGTVFFLGYGATQIENDAFTFRSLQRTSDGLFVKLSYLFRL